MRFISEFDNKKKREKNGRKREIERNFFRNTKDLKWKNKMRTDSCQQELKS